MPSGWEHVADDLRVDLVAALAPYQPNLLPSYPNTAPTAGQIPATLVTSGHPVQYPLLERLENHYAQITLFVDKGKERDLPYIATFTPPATITGLVSGQQVYYENARAIKSMIIQVWSYSRDTRSQITSVLLAHLGDYYRLTHSDGTVTLFRYEHHDNNDYEMLDSVYLAEFSYTADATFTTPYDVSTVQTTALGIEVQPTP